MKTKIIVIAMMGVLLCWSAAWSIPYEFENSGMLLYIASGASYGIDNTENIEDILKQTDYNAGEIYPLPAPPSGGEVDVRYTWGEAFDGYQFELAGKVDYIDGTPSQQEGPYNVIIEPSGNSASGRWTIDGGVNIEFYVIKDANAYALYWLDDLASSGTWSAKDLRDLGLGSAFSISHFSAYNPSVKVPEPAVMLLMGAGLAGFVAIGRRRRGSK